MAIEPGDVVVLKSGGQPMTVAAVDENSVECLWISDEGELFRESIPSVALSVIPGDEDDDDDLDVEDEDEEEEEHDAAGHDAAQEDEQEDEEDEDEDEEDDDKSSKKKRRSA
jgi:uncharacterized protein YodC (DUF2158 family)